LKKIAPRCVVREKEARRTVIRCYITDRHTLAGESLLDAIARNLAAAIEWIQIREKDLSARALFDLVEAALRLPNPHNSKFIVNTRADVAMAAGVPGAAGVHLPSGSPPARFWRRPDFVVGVSCHSVDDVRNAEADGADYVVFGPIFPPRSKTVRAKPLGLDGLRQATSAVRIPVLALGGVTRENSDACISAGAAGIAGITIFQELVKSNS
jgi:thiamine-phosphate pyrophosphorylase